MSTGWFAEFNDEAQQPGAWRPVLQLNGYVAAFDIWFRTKRDCEEWIRANVIGSRMISA